MTFLGWPIERQQLTDRARTRRKTIVLGLIREFKEIFKEIEYELLWDVPTINAQAWRLGSRKGVTVYGGLARHPSLTMCGLGLMLAHETGHHLGGPPLDPDLRWPTWQGQADYWAARHGMPKVFGKKARLLTLRGAKEIESLHSDFCDEGDEPEISATQRTSIFRAGALGEPPPACLQTVFKELFGNS
jgi:hypothetical protein